MSKSSKYVCSAAAGCNQTFAKFFDLKKHEARHAAHGHICTWPGCDFATLIKASYDIHFDKHTGEQRYLCPHNDCDYKTHNPAHLTCHRKKCHGYIPLPRNRGAPSATESDRTPSSSQTPGLAHQFAPPSTYNQPLGVLYGSADTADDYTMYTGPARAPHGWTEGCMCPELMQRRPSEMPGYEYRRY